MNRNIKFRIAIKSSHWDDDVKSSNGWKVSRNSFTIGELIDNEVEMEFDDGDLPIHDIDWAEDEVVYLQYTGLKDKNGREIYEGDIVRAYSWFDEDSPEYDEFTIHEVKWGGEQDYPAFDLYPAIDCGCNALQLYAAVQPEEEAIEVIGNIYENPELLQN